ncbi:unnamed protein product [Darwinula stevensoni]|uniref:Poly [ADP-ribose] polymerase n=1 Tax=Darwinula stevensoni TaxID=69355 RepID=A0A7R9A6A8_9CRUS|nr:unnamed protein product [Darwinula stevensoni]CAG0893930.1 unnamed protein product [Darwinula stevensoni]
MPTSEKLRKADAAEKKKLGRASDAAFCRYDAQMSRLIEADLVADLIDEQDLIAGDEKYRMEAMGAFSKTKSRWPQLLQKFKDELEKRLQTRYEDLLKERDARKTAAEMNGVDPSGDGDDDYRMGEGGGSGGEVECPHTPPMAPFPGNSSPMAPFPGNSSPMAPFPGNSSPISGAPSPTPPDSPDSVCPVFLGRVHDKSMANTRLYAFGYSCISGWYKYVTERGLRRRPASPTISSESSDATFEYRHIPEDWEPMQEEKYKLVTLSPMSQEYEDIARLFENAEMRVNNITRIQNPYLWQVYQDRRFHLLKHDFKDYPSELNEKFLFHGTAVNNIQSICEKNFDWRLHGTYTGSLFGQGVYFGTTPSASVPYAQDNCMLVAKVLIGFSIPGNSSMTTPPSGYHSTSGPDMIIKYHDQDFYPAYIIKY